MEKYKYLLKNVGILTISNIATRFISFFLLPIYTGILTTEEYGIYDLYSTTISLLIPLMTLCISDSVIRNLLDKNSNEKEIVEVGYKYSLISIVFLLVFYIVNMVTNILPIFNQYKLFFILMYIITVFNQLLAGVARGREQMLTISIASLFSSVITILLNIVFLVYFKWRLVGYFGAYIIGISIANIYYFIKLKFWNYIFIGKINKELDKKMRKYGSGLLINSVSWWINLSLDKYVVLYFCGVSANGILSAANKLPTILKTVQNIFENAWILSAVKNYNKEDKDNFFINTYNIYNFFMILITISIIFFTKVLSSFLFKGEFYNAWRMVPFYTIAVMFSAAAGVVGGIFAAEKRVALISNTTLLGAIINAIFNVILIMKFGVIGAALATMISNCVIWMVRIIYVKRIMNFRINILRDAIVYCVILLQAAVLITIKENLLSYCLQLIFVGIIMGLYSKELRVIFRKIREK